MNIKIKTVDGVWHFLQGKDHIKYLGVLIDETVSFKHHISNVCTRISHNNVIIDRYIAQYIQICKRFQVLDFKFHR